ncbi:hypothetical protein GCM10011341_09500 [Frigidibacter albus]|nr:hypothetical protein GCM10011341_09500 [Frigidibacter albus]
MPPCGIKKRRSHGGAAVSHLLAPRALMAASAAAAGRHDANGLHLAARHLEEGDKDDALNGQSEGGDQCIVHLWFLQYLLIPM